MKVNIISFFYYHRCVPTYAGTRTDTGVILLREKERIPYGAAIQRPPHKHVMLQSDRANEGRTMNQNETKHVFPSEIAFLVGLFLTSTSICVFLKSGLGITVISSVPLELHYIIPSIDYGMWNFIYFLFILLLTIILVRHVRKSYVVSIFLGLGYGVIIDVMQPLIDSLPSGGIPLQAVYFAVSMFIISLGLAMFMRCGMPLLPFDTFMRDMILTYRIPYRNLKTLFDIICLLTSIVLSLLFLDGIVGIGVGTIVSALFTGICTSKMIGLLDRYFVFSPASKVVAHALENGYGAIPVGEQKKVDR